MERFSLSFYSEAKKDFKKLDGTQKIFVLKAFNRIIQKGMSAGQALHGELHNCRKLKNKKMGLRIVFTQEDNQINIVEIVAIGYREDMKVYKNAEKRLESHRRAKLNKKNVNRDVNKKTKLLKASFFCLVK